MNVQPKRPTVGELAVPVFPPGTRKADLIASIPGAAQFHALVEQFTAYPEKSYTLPPFRAALYAMVKGLRPHWAIEIGSLFAGTSEILARALSENGQGRLTTIDPFGADRVPGIIASWPEQWRSAVEFKPINSMQLFMDLAGQPERPDFIFIDGNHDYEYALFDLLNAARYVRSGGIIILDNYYDYGVRLAAEKFEADNPAWEIVNFSAHPAFGTTYYALQLGGLYRIYVAPTSVPIGAQARGFKSTIEADGIQGVKLAMTEPSPGGRLSYKVYLRTVPYEFHLGVGEMEEMAASGEINIPPGSTETQVRLAVPLITLTPRESVHRRCEINLLFESDSGSQPLILVAEPEPTVLHR